MKKIFIFCLMFISFIMLFVGCNSNADNSGSQNKTNSEISESVNDNSSFLDRLSSIMSSFTENSKSQTESSQESSTGEKSSNTSSSDSYKEAFTIFITGNIENELVCSDKSEYFESETVVLSILNKSGYELTSLIVDNKEVINNVENQRYIFTMPSHNVTVSFTFKKLYVISINNSQNGKVVADYLSAVAGTKITITPNPDNGYICEEIELKYANYAKKLAAEDSDKYSFIMPENNVILNAKFFETDSREYVDYLVLGDSYVDYRWDNFSSDFSNVKNAKLIGIGGTLVPEWINGLSGELTHKGVSYDVNVSAKYNVSNFIFHVGVNDIDINTPTDTVVENLKEMFSLYHNAYPNAKIYWVSMTLAMIPGTNTAKYLDANAKIKAYVENVDYLEYVDTCSIMFPLNQPNPDWFVDGMHFNADGYDTWSGIILEKIGYSNELKDFGKADNFYSSTTFKENEKGELYNIGQQRSEQTIWFKNFFERDFYFETHITVNQITNSDLFPKFGLSLKTDSNHVFFYMDVGSSLSGNECGITVRQPEKLSNGFMASDKWNWGLGLVETASCSYTNENYVKLGLLKSCSDLFFFVNDKVVNSITGLSGTDGKSAVGITVFNLNVTIKNYACNKNVEEIISKLNKPSKSLFEDGDVTLNGNSISNQTKGNEVSFYAKNVYSNVLFCYSEFTLNKVLNNDEYPKAGIFVEADDVGTLFFYIDSENKGNFGQNLVLGCVFRPKNGEWQWKNSKQVSVSKMEYVNGKYAKLGLYKKGENFVLTLDNSFVLSVTFSQFNLKTKVGVKAFNLSFNVKNFCVATSEKVVDLMYSKINSK